MFSQFDFGLKDCDMALLSPRRITPFLGCEKCVVAYEVDSKQ